MWKRYALLVILLIVGILFSRLLAAGDHHVDEGVAYLLNDVQTARTELERANSTEVPARRGEALGAASGALHSASQVAEQLAADLKPKSYATADPYDTILLGTNQLLSYCSLLTPDMTAPELQRRLDLLGGLEQALAAGVTGKAGQGQVPAVDRNKLVDSWRDYLVSLNPARDSRQPPGNLKIADPPTPVHISASAAGADLTVNISWDRTYTVFPEPWKQTLLLYSAQPLELVSWQSTAPNQDGLGQAGGLAPVEPVAAAKPLLETFRAQLPAAWTDPTHLVAVYVLEGLPQTVTLHLSGPASGVELYYLQHRGVLFAEAKRIQ